MTTGKINRHCENIDMLLLEYASGTLDEALSLVVASWVSVSPAARREFEACERIGGALMEKGCTPVAMGATSLQAVLDRLECEKRKAALCREAASRAASAEEEKYPGPLRDYMACPSHAGRWKKVLPGVMMQPVNISGCAHQLMLCRAVPGAKTPHHVHDDVEITLVLDGGFSDEFGTYDAGDLVIYEAGAEHTPVADKNEGCVCLVATGGKIHFTGFFARFLNPFLR